MQLRLEIRIEREAGRPLTPEVVDEGEIAGGGCPAASWQLKKPHVPATAQLSQVRQPSHERERMRDS